MPDARAWWRASLARVWIALVASIVALSFLPDTNAAVALVQPAWSDSVHVAVYALLTLITILLLEVRVPEPLRLVAMVVVGISMFGGLIELLQQLVGRTASALDGAWNGLGALVAACGYLAWIGRRANANGPR